MTYSTFLNVIQQLQKQDHVLQKLYKYNINLLDLVDPYHSIISDLIKEIYGEEGYDWFSWFCYENNYGKGELKAWDENKNNICYDVKTLWEYLEYLKKVKVSLSN